MSAEDTRDSTADRCNGKQLEVGHGAVFMLTSFQRCLWGWVSLLLGNSPVSCQHTPPLQLLSTCSSAVAAPPNIQAKLSLDIYCFSLLAHSSGAGQSSALDMASFAQCGDCPSNNALKAEGTATLSNGAEGAAYDTDGLWLCATCGVGYEIGSGPMPCPICADDR